MERLFFSLVQPGSIKSFPLETLFYMFYSMCAEEGQVLAAEELWSRGWCYHREHKLWLARVPNTEPVVKTDRCVHNTTHTLRHVYLFL